ncbi:MAG: HD domain-containing phosphohydrolase [Myxococcota bacterium]
MVQQGRILIVDDEFGPRESLKMILKQRYECHTVETGESALRFLESDPDIDLVTLDLKMPGMSGIETLAEIKKKDPDIEAIIITGVGTVETLSKALQVGAFDHVDKPYNLAEINLLVRRAITRRQLREKFKSLFPRDASVSEMVTEYLNKRYRKDDVSFLDFVRVFSLAMQDKDPEIFSHVNRVTFLSMLLADRFGFPPEERENLQIGALLHDIGKFGLGIPVGKPSEEMNRDERAVFRQHPRRGAEILEPLGVSPTISAIIRWHHERHDGSGYPDGLRGDEIPLAVRIVSLVNAYDNMTRHQRAGEALNDRDVQLELKRQAGREFDPLLVKTFLRTLQTGGIVQLNKLFGSVIDQKSGSGAVR